MTEWGERMSRVEDVSKALDGIWKLDVTNNTNYRIAMVGLLGHIAAALAVIADNMSEEKENKNA